MGASLGDVSSLLVPSMSFAKGMASALDLGATLTTYNVSPTPECADRFALTNDLYVVCREMEKAMNANG